MAGVVFFIHATTGAAQMNHIQSPATGDQAVERAIVSAGANVAPRVTPADIEAAIVSEHYFTAREGRVGHAGSRWCAAGHL